MVGKSMKNYTFCGWFLKYKQAAERLIDLKSDTMMTFLLLVIVYKFYTASELTVAHASIAATVFGLKYAGSAVREVKSALNNTKEVINGE